MDKDRAKDELFTIHNEIAIGVSTSFAFARLGALNHLGNTELLNKIDQQQTLQFMIEMARAYNAMFFCVEKSITPSWDLVVEILKRELGKDNGEQVAKHVATGMTVAMGEMKELIRMNDEQIAEVIGEMLRELGDEQKT